MPPIPDNIREKLQKLRIMATRGTVNEAAVASAMLSDMLFRYGLTADSLLDDNKPFMRNETDTPSRTWQARLFAVLCKQHNCCAIGDGGRIVIVGKAQDAEIVREMHTCIADVVKTLAGLGLVLSDNPPRTTSTRRRWMDDFALGAVTTIAARLREQRARTVAETDSTALVLHRTAALEKAVLQFYPTLYRGRSMFARNGAAYVAGKRMGEGLTLNRAVQNTSRMIEGR